MLKDAIIAEVNALMRGLIHGDFDASDFEGDGLEVETANFMLKISIDRGLCEECMEHPPMFDAEICEQCNTDRMDRQHMINWYGEE